MTRTFATLLAMLLAGQLAAAIRTQDIEYTAGDTVLKGCLAFDDAAKDKRPGVVIVHEWWGLNEYVKGRARQLAELGYVALAADMYGKDMVTTDAKQAGAWAEKVRGDRALLLRRTDAALKVLRADEHVDANRLAAMGYCFGGTVALEIARSGEPLRGVISFHGSLGTSKQAGEGDIKASVLVLTGADDPFCPPDALNLFEDEMRRAKADWQVVSYGGAGHSFTNPESTKMGVHGVGYDEKADKRSWQAMKDFLDEVFSRHSAESRR